MQFIVKIDRTNVSIINEFSYRQFDIEFYAFKYYAGGSISKVSEHRGKSKKSLWNMYKIHGSKKSQNTEFGFCNMPMSI